MKKLNKLSIAILAATASTFVSAVELGEVKGTTFSIGGYLKAEAIWGMPDSGDNSVEGTTRQSRFNLKAEKNIDGHKVTGFIESDFWENSSYSDAAALRLRHAYISIDNLTVGQTWSGNFFATAPFDARMINFFGPGWGTIGGNGGTVRPSLVAHYRTNGFTLSAAEPLYDNAEMPDLVVAYAQRFEGGSGYSAAITAREVEQLSDDSDIGAAISIQGKLAIGNGALFAGAFTGKGQGPNTGLCVGGTWNPGNTASCDIDATGKLISQTGFNLGVTQNLTSNLNGTLRYGKVEVDDAADTSAYMTTATLMYSYLPDLDFGIEWRDQDMANHPLRPAGQQVEVMALYKF